MSDIIKSDLILADQILPVKLPVLPLHSRPVFPEMVIPIVINDKNVMRIIDYVMQHEEFVGLVLVKDIEQDDGVDNYHRIGTAARIIKKINLPDGSVSILINSVKRIHVKKFISQDPVKMCVVEYLYDNDSQDDETKALTRAIFSDVKSITENNPLFSEEVQMSIVNVSSPGKLADFVASILSIDRNEQQAVLSEFDVKARLNMVLQLLHKEKELLLLQKKIEEQINEKISSQQREFFLREQLKVIKQELGMDVDPRSSDHARFEKKMKELELSDDVTEKLQSELGKLAITETSSPEYGVIRNYLEIALALPWNSESELQSDINKSKEILDKSHYGLTEVKERILEYLAVQVLRKRVSGSILCLVGPPGVGKTSLGKSVAAAMGREFFRFSLGGMRDEAEIKGHRRTYIGAMPGKILEALKNVKTRNPVLMLDEIDKLGKSYQGDPSSALLEVLDPEQNSSFRDHYLDIPFDLSDVFFITTANSLDSIPTPLLDRMEIIRLSGYITEEKVEIASKYIIKKAIKDNGLTRNVLSFNKSALVKIADDYAREAGVRNLEKQIKKIIRKVGLAYLQNHWDKPLKIKAENLNDWLGEPVFRKDEARKIDRPGLAIGLAWTAYGGAILTMECLANEGKGSLKFTGNLGNVMKESAIIAYSYSKKISVDESVGSKWFEERELHLHVPAGATPKDGPSAGITMASAMLSLCLGKKIRNNLGMTGELSLSGDVLPIGGLKEKVIAAKRSGLKEVIFPAWNRTDLNDIPEKVKKGISFYPVSRMEEVSKIIFAKGDVRFEGVIKN